MDKNMGAAFMSTLLIIAVFAIYKYLKNFKNNQSEKTTAKVKNEHAIKTKDFSTQAENLKSLRDSDVLSESEYNNKIEKINEDKLEYLVTKTDEYLNLKALYNSGVFTRDEFEIKFDKLKILHKKVILEESILKTDVKKDKEYLDNNLAKNKKVISSNLYHLVKSILITLLILTFLFVIIGYF